MLQRIGSPDTVLAYRAVGKIEKGDYETVLTPAVEAMIAENGEVRFVYVLGDEFDAYTAGATWEDSKLGLRHATKWIKIAVVTNHDGSGIWSGCSAGWCQARLRPSPWQTRRTPSNGLPDSGADTLDT